MSEKISGKLIMPKQTGQKDAFYSSLQLYYESYKKGESWYSNKEFKQQIQKLLPYLGQGAKNGPYLVKQSELTRYFGLVYYDYSCNTGKAHITQEGIKFYEAYLQGENELQMQMIVEAILNNSFGRNNTAIKTSDSDVDPPKLLLKAINDLGGITSKEFAYLLYITHDLKISYDDAIVELSKSDNSDREIPMKVVNKYNDVKFTGFLAAVGITECTGGKYRLSDYTKKFYSEEITKLSIYNKKPDLVLTLQEEAFDDSENITAKEAEQEKVISSFSYNIESDRFKIQNNRLPVSYNKGGTKRYKTNARIAKTALELSGYICLCDNRHTTFISKLGKQYMEAHHLIPMAAQKDFSINLDRVENIVSLCPICHSAIHLGDATTRIEILKKIYGLKEKDLKAVGLYISFDDLFSKYYR